MLYLFYGLFFTPPQNYGKNKRYAKIVSVYNAMFDISISCEIIGTSKQINIFISSYTFCL